MPWPPTSLHIAASSLGRRFVGEAGALLLLIGLARLLALLLGAAGDILDGVVGAFRAFGSAASGYGDVLLEVYSLVEKS